MTDDIVERLRGHWRAAGQGCTSLCMQCAAADEIERLRAVIDAALIHLHRGEGVQAINTLEAPC